jgi:hypothetical protein
MLASIHKAPRLQAVSVGEGSLSNFDHLQTAAPPAARPGGHFEAVLMTMRSKSFLLLSASGYAELFSLEERSLNRRSTHPDRYRHLGQFLRR